MNKRMGDEKWNCVLSGHFARASALVVNHSGYYVKDIGDSVLAVFRSSTDALRFAIEFESGPGHAVLAIRAGVHTGQVIVSKNDISGREVNFTALMYSKAKAGGIWVSDRVYKDWNASYPDSGLVWTDEGEVELKYFGRNHLWSLPPSSPSDQAACEATAVGNAKEVSACLGRFLGWQPPDGNRAGIALRVTNLRTRIDSCTNPEAIAQAQRKIVEAHGELTLGLLKALERIFNETP